MINLPESKSNRLFCKYSDLFRLVSGGVQVNALPSVAIDLTCAPELNL